MVDTLDDVTIDNGNEVIRYKIIFIGDVSVGKTSIMNRLVENKYKEYYEPSIGVDFSSKIVKYKGKSIKLQIWDSAGQERYKGLIPSYIRGATLVFVVYDINSKILIILEKETFNNALSWINFTKNIENPLITLVGNKIDLDRKVTYQEGLDLATKEGTLFFEMSSKTNENVMKTMFEVISHFPYFSSLKINRQKIVSDLVLENNGGLENSQDLGNILKQEKSKERNICKC